MVCYSHEKGRRIPNLAELLEKKLRSGKQTVEKAFLMSPEFTQNRWRGSEPFLAH